MVKELQEQLGVNRKVAHLLCLRGIDTFEKAKAFFRPELSHIHDPFLMKDMDAATERLARAIREKEKVLVYGDYDVDGTTATAVLFTILEEFGVEVEYYIPHRFKEGYGVNPEGIRYAEEMEADLLVTVDCGITAVEEVEQAREKGIDVIICDHHNVGDHIPNAVAVLDPKRPDCEYPFKGLSGAGVAFKLVQGTLHQLGLKPTIAYKLLDLVAISIASDIVPIEDENRVLMWKGLQQINKKPRTGIGALLKCIKVKPGTVTSSNIVFSIGPRINAAGRMGDATKAVQMLIAETPSEARRRAKELEDINQVRRDTDTQTMDEACDLVEKHFNLEQLSSVILHQPHWHLGVIGIVASRLVETYHRPTVMLSTVDGKIKGSARSIEGFNIYDAFKECEDLLEQFGGHKYAAGLTILPENLEEFKFRMNQITAGYLSSRDFEPELRIDCNLDLGDVNKRFWKLLSQFEPYGPGNLQPVFVSENVRVVGVPTIVGKGHLKMRVAQNGSGTFEVIGFNMHEYLPLIRKSKDRQLNIAYSLEENHWNGRRSLQIRLRDIQVMEKKNRKVGNSPFA